MDTKLAQHFTYGKLLKFVFPSIVMMIFTSIYSVVDGLFVSNFVGKTAFASINLIMPFIMGLTALGFMMGTGLCPSEFASMESHVHVWNWYKCT